MTLDDRPDLRLELARQLQNSAARGIDPTWEHLFRLQRKIDTAFFWLTVLSLISITIGGFTLSALLYAVLE